MKNSDKYVKKYQCSTCRRWLPMTMQFFNKCNGCCNRWICYECLQKNRCDFNSLHLTCPECIKLLRLFYRLPVYLTRCKACAEKYGHFHDHN